MSRQLLFSFARKLAYRTRARAERHDALLPKYWTSAEKDTVAEYVLLTTTSSTDAPRSLANLESFDWKAVSAAVKTRTPGAIEKHVLKAKAKVRKDMATRMRRAVSFQSRTSLMTRVPPRTLSGRCTLPRFQDQHTATHVYDCITLSSQSCFHYPARPPHALQIHHMHTFQPRLHPRARRFRTTGTTTHMLQGLLPHTTGLKRDRTQSRV